MFKTPYIVITCEHATNHIPSPFHHLFSKAVLATHRGIDFGALTLAKRFSRHFRAPLYQGKVSRLLVDLNRSTHHPTIFSRMLKPLSPDRKQRILNTYYVPYRKMVEQRIKQKVQNKHPILHLSIHSFTPVLKNKRRYCDIGLLFDPKRQLEKKFCEKWKSSLRRTRPHFQIRLNYPYLGTSDGLTTTFRKQFSSHRYMGIEIEINQKYPLKDPDLWELLQKILINTCPGMRFPYQKSLREQRPSRKNKSPQR